MKCLFSIVGLNGNRFLQNDRAGIHSPIDQMDGYSCHPGACAQGISHGMGAWESGKECRVDIEDAVAVGAHKGGTQDSHEPCEKDVIDFSSFEVTEKGSFVGRA